MIQAAYDISVIICAYTEARWDALVAAVQSVRQQTLPPREIIVVIDHNPGLMERVREHEPGVVVVENKEARGLSGARNSGIAISGGRIIAFLDDDADAAPDWLMTLSKGYTHPRMLGNGGSVLPRWSHKAPAWLPEEFYWVVGCTYRGMPQTVATIRNPIGANMAFRREVFGTVGGFRSGIGRVGTRPVGCEETELCIRAHQYWPERAFLYQPRAIVFHRVADSRTGWRYFCARCYAEGLSKADISRFVGSKDSLASERDYTLRTLPQGIIRGLADAIFHRDPSGFLRAGTIVTGLIITALGYFVGRVVSTAARSGSATTIEAGLQRDTGPLLSVETDI